MQAYVLVDLSTTAQEQLGPLYALGLCGAANGYHYNEGGAVVAVRILNPAAFDAIDANPLLTRLPNPADPTPDSVKQHHVDKLHDEVKASLKTKDKLDKDGKLKGNMTGRELGQHLHDQYKKFTKYLHPDWQ